MRSGDATFPALPMCSILFCRNYVLGEETTSSFFTFIQYLASPLRLPTRREIRGEAKKGRWLLWCGLVSTKNLAWDHQFVSHSPLSTQWMVATLGPCWPGTDLNQCPRILLQVPWARPVHWPLNIMKKLIPQLELFSRESWKQYIAVSSPASQCSCPISYGASCLENTWPE